MSPNSMNLGTILRLIFSVILVVIGSYIFFGYVNLDLTHRWLPLLVVLVGVFSMPTDSRRSALPSMVMIAVGVFALLREFNIINLPVLRYGLGGSLIVFGGYGVVKILAVKPSAKL